MQMGHDLHRYLKIGNAVELIYVDRTNRISRRKVKLISIDNEYVHTFCYSRKAPRIFLINNILAVSPPQKRIKSMNN